MVARMNIDLSQGKSFQDFLESKNIEIIPPTEERYWEAFRIKQNGATSIFFAFASTRTLECYDKQGQDLLVEFLSGGVRFPIHA